MTNFEQYIINKTKNDYFDMLGFLMYFCGIDSADDIATTENLTVRQLAVFKVIMEKCYYLSKASE